MFKKIDWKLILIVIATIVYSLPTVFLEKFPQTGEGGFIFALYLFLPIFIVVTILIRENFNNWLKKYEESCNVCIRGITKSHLERTDQLTKELIEEILKNELLQQKLSGEMK